MTLHHSNRMIQLFEISLVALLSCELTLYSIACNIPTRQNVCMCVCGCVRAMCSFNGGSVVQLMLTNRLADRRVTFILNCVKHA